jgi:hypothetical protein
MTNRAHRPQKADLLELQVDLRPLVVAPLTNLDDRRHNPKDIDVDEAAIANGVQHGGNVENRAASLAARGRGGRKRSEEPERSRSRRDNPKTR